MMAQARRNGSGHSRVSVGNKTLCGPRVEAARGRARPAKGDMSSVSIEGCFAHLRHLFGRLATTADRRPPEPARPMADPRIAITVTLLLVITAAAAWPRSPRPGAAAAKPEDALAGAAAVRAGPVRIVGATPRSDNCSEQ